MNQSIRSILVTVERLPVEERAALLAELARRYPNPSSPQLTHPVLDDHGTLRCPRCDGAVWDNRDGIACGRFNQRYPTFKCRNGECGWVTWHKTDGQARREGSPKHQSPPASDDWWADGRRKRKKQSFDDWQRECRANEPDGMPF